MFDTVIENARIFDGSGRPCYRGSVGIKEQRIAAIWRSSPPVQAGEVIDAKGLALCPGIIDAHGHSDFTILHHPGACNLISQGVTTQVVGHCGFSMYAFSPEYVSQVEKTIQITSGAALDEVDWQTLPEWRDKVESNGTALNLVPLVGHNTLRYSAMGHAADSRIEVSTGEMQVMKELLRQGLDAGAYGLSTGLRYPYGRNATTEEIIALCHLVAEYDGVHMSHLRSEEECLLPSVDEFIAISERTGVPGCVAHFKALFCENWGTLLMGLQALEKARARGVDVVMDVYPWIYARQINLGAWFGGPLLTAGARKKYDRPTLLSMLQDEVLWEKLKVSLTKQHEILEAENQRRKDEMLKRHIAVPDIWHLERYDCVLHSPTYPHFYGYHLARVAQALDLPDHWEAMRHLFLADRGATQVGVGPMNERDVRLVLTSPFSMVGTDASACDRISRLDEPQTSVHPRGWGTYPKVLGEYVRNGVLSLEEAIPKMTSYPAAFLGLKDRGFIREGFWADLLLFDPATIVSHATFARPWGEPEGIINVMVNGQKVVDSGAFQQHVYPGRVLLK